MSSATLRVWEEYEKLSIKERREFIARFRAEWDQHLELEELVPMRPPGYFDDIYTKDEIELENRLAKSCVIEFPKDLE